MSFSRNEAGAIGNLHEAKQIRIRGSDSKMQDLKLYGSQSPGRKCFPAMIYDIKTQPKVEFRWKKEIHASKEMKIQEIGKTVGRESSL